MPTTLEALLIFLYLLTPGYVVLFITQHYVAHTIEPAQLKYVIVLGLLGFIIHLPVYPFWTHRIMDYYLADTLSSHRQEVFLWSCLVVVFWPTLAGLIVGWLMMRPKIDAMLDRIGLSYVDRLPSAWDWVIREEGPAYVKIFMRDGSSFGGVFADRSIASIAPQQRDVFLERVWLLDEDGNFRSEAPGNTGVWIAHEAIGRIEFYRSEAHGSEEQSTETAR